MLLDIFLELNVQFSADHIAGRCLCNMFKEGL